MRCIACNRLLTDNEVNLYSAEEFHYCFFGNGCSKFDRGDHEIIEKYLRGNPDAEE